MFHLSKNHPFVDGNKRTAFLSGMLFLEKNDIQVQLEREEGAEMLRTVVSQNIDIKRIAEFLSNRASNSSYSLSNFRR